MKEKIYRYTHQRLQAGDPPTIREVQRAMGLKAVESARSHLEALVQEGRLVKRSTRSRSYALPPEERTRGQRVPILGHVQAGALTTAVEDIEGYVQVEREGSRGDFFALRVRGWSMRDAGILPGDLVVTKRQESADSGDIVVALVEEEATVKRLLLSPRERRVTLQPENPDFEPIEVEAQNLRLLGKVVEVRRYL